MTIKQAIEKAIEGGWLKGSKFRTIAHRDGSYLTGVAFFTMVSCDGDQEDWSRDVLALFSDPLFWQSLGKAMGWGGKMIYHQEKWLYEWHCFIDHLAEGKDAESFFQVL